MPELGRLGRLERWVGPLFWKKARAVFVLSTGRAGTMSLTKLLAISPKIRAAHEPRPMLLEESKVAFSEVWDDVEQYAQIFRNARAHVLGGTYLRRQIYAETANHLAFLSPAIATLVPGAKFIHLYRHPADVVRSGMRRGWYNGHPWDRFRIKPASDDPAARHWDHWNHFEKNCWYWRAANEFALRFISSIDPTKSLCLKFEDLFGTEAGVCQSVFEFLNVPCPAQSEIHAVLATRYNQQTSGSFPRRHNWSQEQRRTLQRITGSTMQRLGYSLDRLEELDPYGCV